MGSAETQTLEKALRNAEAALESSLAEVRSALAKMRQSRQDQAVFDTDGGWLTISEACRIYPGLEPSRLQKACQRSGLGAKDAASGQWRINQGALEAYVRNPRATMADRRRGLSTSSANCPPIVHSDGDATRPSSART